MNRFRSLTALVPGLVLVLAACTGTTESTTFETVGAAASEEPSQAESAAPTESAEATEEPGGGEETVRLSQFAFDTAELTIAAGTEVSFVNADAAPHTVTEGTDGEATDDPIIDEELQQNGTASFTFDEPGTYEITCLFHAQMNMTVIVE